MIDIKFKEEIYSIKNEIGEINVKDFEHIISILNNDTKNYLEKWSDIFIFLGTPIEVVDNFDISDFIEIIKLFNLTSIDLKEIKKSIIINGIEHFAYTDNDFKLTVKETILIESYIKKNDNRYLGELIAIVYKNPSVTKEINFDKSHIHHKAEMIRKEITADIALPIIGFLSKKLIKDVEILNTNE